MTGRRIRVGLLFGGRSPEHEISITTAAAIAKEADPERFEIVPIYISREGRWLRLESGGAFARLAGRFARDRDVDPIPRHEVVLSGAATASLVPIASRKATEESIDVLFPALHGQGGEDGSVQGLARLADLPCVGAGLLGSALGMDKISMKQLAIAHDIPVPRFVPFSRWDWERDPASIRENIAASLKMPVFVKPSGAGSSVGITKVKAPADLDAAVAEAALYDYRILVEQGIDARELEVAILGNDQPEASVVGEILPAGEFYDYASKYADEGSRTIIPADIPPAVSDRIRVLAVRMFLALDLSGMARADFLLDRSDGSVYCNELNTIPGFTPISMYPALWEASGVPYRDLLTRLIDLAIERHQATRVETRPRHLRGAESAR